MCCNKLKPSLHNLVWIWPPRHEEHCASEKVKAYWALSYWLPFSKSKNNIIQNLNRSFSQLGPHIQENIWGQQEKMWKTSHSRKEIFQQVAWTSVLHQQNGAKTADNIHLSPTMCPSIRVTTSHHSLMRFPSGHYIICYISTL